MIQAGHPVPDLQSVRAAEEALRLAAGLERGQHLLVLVSGGGSALMSSPWGVTLEEKQALTQALLASGAGIDQLNTVRKHLSRVKGGRLAEATPARVTALLLSDVVGDDPATIASGPTVPDPGTYAAALAVLDTYAIAAPEARAHLRRGLLGELPETPKLQGWPHDRVAHQVIGSGRLMMEAARTFLKGQGVEAVLLGELTGEAREVAAAQAQRLRTQPPGDRPRVLLAGGETTVTLDGSPGVGGRNQEFALALLNELGPLAPYALCAGSDGMDGNSGAAGAFLTPDSHRRAQAMGLDPADFLRRHDAGTFFARLGDQLVTGPSGTNLNDFQALWLDR